MALHYAVIADFTLSRGHPSLVGLELYSTTEACTHWPVPGSLFKVTYNKHVFQTLKEAHSYIAHLKKTYPNSPVPFPVLDSGQQELFQEVSE
jgi:hypothetical protein